MPVCCCWCVCVFGCAWRARVLSSLALHRPAFIHSLTPRPCALPLPSTPLPPLPPHRPKPLLPRHLTQSLIPLALVLTQRLLPLCRHRSGSITPHPKIRKCLAIVRPLTRATWAWLPLTQLQLQQQVQGKASVQQWRSSTLSHALCARCWIPRQTRQDKTVIRVHQNDNARPVPAARRGARGGVVPCSLMLARVVAALRGRREIEAGANPAAAELQLQLQQGQALKRRGATTRGDTDAATSDAKAAGAGATTADSNTAAGAAAAAAAAAGVSVSAGHKRAQLEQQDWSFWPGGVCCC